MLTSKKVATIKKPIVSQELAIVATEFHMEWRESYYKVQFRDVEGQTRTIPGRYQSTARP